MTLDDLVGAKLVVGFPGAEASDELIVCLRATRAQSLVLFERNIVSPGQLTALLRRLEEAVGRRLLVMVDHEGGRVVRFRQGVTRFPDARTAGAAHDAAAIERQGATEAKELRALGVSVNLAPCVDVVVEGSDPIIGDRSYGADPRKVSELAVARIRGLQDSGVAACAKHFPGLGAVPKDPHRHLPTIGLEWPTMDAVHLVPFRAAIASGVAMVMSSHVCYPGLGEPPGLPATFSPRLIRDLLRQQMGFHGLILTDDLQMGALRSFGTMGELAVRATEAGHDLLLVCSDLSAAIDAADTIRNSYKERKLSKYELEETARRLDRLKEKIPPSP